MGRVDLHPGAVQRPPAAAEPVLPPAAGAPIAGDWDEHWQEFNPSHPVIARGFRRVFDGPPDYRAQPLPQGGRRALALPAQSPTSSRRGRTNLSILFNPVVADGIVYGSIEVPTSYRPQRLQSVPITYYLPARRLVAIDLDSGDVLWSHEEEALDRGGDARMRNLTIVGPPLVRGDRLYVGACRERTELFHNLLLAIDRRTGKLIYETRISQGQQELNLFGRKLNEAAGTPIAEADGVLYYGTNQGVVAAVDALLGTPLWATTYAVIPIPSTYLWFEAPRRWPRFDNGPPLVAGDKLIIAPSDGRAVMALQRTTGRLLWRNTFVGDRDFGFRPGIVQGVDDERVFLSGDDGVAAVWLHDKEGVRKGGTTAWLQPFPDDEDTDSGAGRGLLSKGELWIPAYAAIFRYDPVTGKALSPIHKRKPDDRDRDVPVNLVAGDGVLITAGRDFLCARYEEDEVIALVKGRMRKAPGAIAPMLGAADVFLATGRLGWAAERYKQARAAAAKRGLAVAERRAAEGLHRTLLTRAQNRLHHDLSKAPRDFDAAIKAAPDARTRYRARRHLDRLLASRSGAEVSTWRLRNLRDIERDHGSFSLDGEERTVRGWALREMAQILVSLNEPRRAIDVLQRLIENDPAGPEGRHASGQLRDILLSEGRVHYLTYEKRARRLFKATLESGDLGALERGLLIYSNAEAAADATIELASRRLRAGEAGPAATALQRFLVEHPGARQVPQALVLMVRALHERRSYGQAFPPCSGCSAHTATRRSAGPTARACRRRSSRPSG